MELGVRARERALRYGAEVAEGIHSKMRQQGKAVNGQTVQMEGRGKTLKQLREDFKIGSKTAQVALQVVESRLSMAGAEMAFLAGKKRRMTPALADDDDSFPVEESKSPSLERSSFTGRPRAVEDGFQAASIVAAEVLQALEDGNQATSKNLISQLALKKRFKCGSPMAAKVQCMAKARLSMCGLTSTKPSGRDRNTFEYKAQKLPLDRKSPKKRRDTGLGSKRRCKVEEKTLLQPKMESKEELKEGALRRRLIGKQTVSGLRPRWRADVFRPLPSASVKPPPPSAMGTLGRWLRWVKRLVGRRSSRSRRRSHRRSRHRWQSSCVSAGASVRPKACPALLCMSQVPGWSMNLILFCGRSSAPQLAAVCHRMAKPLLQDARQLSAELREKLQKDWHGSFRKWQSSDEETLIQSQSAIQVLAALTPLEHRKSVGGRESNASLASTGSRSARKQELAEATSTVDQARLLRLETHLQQMQQTIYSVLRV